MNSKKDLLIVITGLLLGLDIQESELSRVSSLRQVLGRTGMCVVPTRSGGAWSKTTGQLTVRKQHGRSFLHGAVIDRIDMQSMPVNELRHRCLVKYLNT